MNPYLHRMRGWLWWLIPFAALALVLGIETDWGRGIHRLPGPAPTIEAKPVSVALLPEYRVDGGLDARSETVSRTLFNPTRRPAPALAAEARSSMPKGRFVLTGTAVAGDRHIAFLKEVANGKSRVVRQGEQVNGVLVASVTASGVRLTMGDEAEDLVLKVVAGPKTTTQPTPAAGAPPGAAPGAAPPVAMPGAVPPVATTPTGVPAPPPRRIVPAGAPPGPVPGAETTPKPASGTTQSTPASADPAWNEVYERMRQRNPTQGR